MPIKQIEMPFKLNKIVLRLTIGFQQNWLKWSFLSFSMSFILKFLAEPTRVQLFNRKMQALYPWTIMC